MPGVFRSECGVWSLYMSGDFRSLEFFLEFSGQSVKSLDVWSFLGVWSFQVFRVFKVAGVFRSECDVWSFLGV